MWDQDLYPYKGTGKIAVLYNFIYVLGSKMEDNILK
jgi:hypothetical protein